MAEYRIEISDAAKHDIRSIVSYIQNELKEPAIAEKMSDGILDGIFKNELHSFFSHTGGEQNC